MTTDAWLLVFLLTAMFALLMWGKFPTWVVFIGTLTAAMTLKLAPLDGFRSAHLLVREIRDQERPVWHLL